MMLRPATSRPFRLAALAVSVLLLALASAGCEEGSGQAQSQIIHDDVPRVQTIIREDLDRGMVGVERAATKIARGFLVEDHEQREREMRRVLHLLREPPRGIPELMISPISFVAAVGDDGKVICRDVGADGQDRMAGFDAALAFDVVRRALREGESGYALDLFPSNDLGQDGTQLVLYAAPARHDGRVVGAVLAGTPLWRTSQRLWRQLQADHAQDIAAGAIFWAYLYKGGELHHRGTPADLDSVLPSAAARAEALARSPGGYTGELVQFGRWYAYGVVPLPRLGPDVGAILVRSNP